MESQKARREGDQKKIFLRNNGQNFPISVTVINLQSQAQQTPSRKNYKENHAWIHHTKLLKVRDKISRKQPEKNDTWRGAVM